MKIFVKSQQIITASQQIIPASKQVNRVGRYLYKTFKGLKYTTSSNMCDVYIMLLYAEPESNDVQEMILDINITTYQNKIRINIIEVTPKEQTIGFDLYTSEEMMNLQEASKKIYQKILKRVYRAYEDFDFLV